MEPMRFQRCVFVVVAAVMAVAFMVASPALAQKPAERSYLMATATTGGTYYPVGVAIATLAKVKLEPKYHFSLSAITSAGSAENIKLMRENQVQFSILQGLFGAWAWNGTGDFKTDGPQRQFRSISMLWFNTEHFAILSDYVKSGTIMDMANIKGKKFSIGARKSGTEGSGRTILTGLGFDPDKDFDLAYLGYNPSADALQNGTIAGFNIPGGVPVSAIAQAAAVLKEKMRILNVTPAELKKVNSAAKIDLWVPFTIPANTYAGQTEPVHTIAQPNFLAVRADIPDDVVYELTKAIYENLAFLRNIHKSTQAMALDKAIGGLPFPLHPGAASFYKEKGLTIPASLVAK
jgi:TRAP transporter TAXI family solute receptor